MTLKYKIFYNRSIFIWVQTALKSLIDRHEYEAWNVIRFYGTDVAWSEGNITSLRRKSWVLGGQDEAVATYELDTMAVLFKHLTYAKNQFRPEESY